MRAKPKCPIAPPAEPELPAGVRHIREVLQEWLLEHESQLFNEPGRRITVPLAIAWPAAAASSAVAP
jgi:hypothetical protein